MKKNWLPDLHQISHQKTLNPSWIHSAWLGAFYAFVFFPTMIWEWCLKPFVKGFIKAFVSLFCFVVAGLQGRLHSDFDTVQEAYEKAILKQLREFDTEQSGER